MGTDAASVTRPMVRAPSVLHFVSAAMSDARVVTAYCSGNWRRLKIHRASLSVDVVIIILLHAWRAHVVTSHHFCIYLCSTGFNPLYCQNLKLKNIAVLDCFVACSDVPEHVKAELCCTLFM